jgi:hypothetical protein
VVSALSVFFIHTAAVETFLGAGAGGDTYAASADVKGFLDDGIIRVQSSAGEQLEQKSIFYAALSDAAKFVDESRVTVNGRACQVTGVRRRDGGSLGLPDHVEVDLT